MAISRCVSLESVTERLVDAVLGRQLAGRNQLIGSRVELGVPKRAFDGLVIVGEDALDPLVVKQARTVDDTR